MKKELNSCILESSENEEKPRKGKKLRLSKSGIKKSISQSNNNIVRIKSNEFERSEESSYKMETKSLNYQQELYKTFSKFLYAKKFKLSNEFDARHSKKFLEQKNKYLERIILSDVIEADESCTVQEDTCPTNDNINNSKSIDKRRKSNTQKNLKNYCIIISNYDDETSTKKQFNFSVRNTARKLNNNIKKNKNLSKYCSNKEAKNQFLGV